MRIYGVDFTSRPTRSKPICCAVCSLSDDVLTFESILKIENFRDFEASLARGGPWVAGFDFPFGQSRRFIENIGWPQTWAGYVSFVATLERDAFRQVLESYKAERPYGDREHSRGFEVGTGAASPQKLYGVPVALMFFEGAARLLQSGMNLPGLVAGDNQRVGVEAYPGMAARALLGSRTPYKADERRKQTALQLAARQAILNALKGGHGRSLYGLDVNAPDWLAHDPTGDSLDALLCAVQAAWATRTVLKDETALAGIDPLEGWIADPALFGAV